MTSSVATIRSTPSVENCAANRAESWLFHAAVNQAVVDSVNAGIAPFPGEPELPELLAQAVMAGNLRASTDTSAAVASSEAVLVVVPVVVDAHGAPDFGAIDAATRDIAISVCPGTLVSYETTLPLGTTRNRFGPMLGSDLYLVHGPERVFTGRIFADLRRYPKLLGGVDEPSAKKGVEFGRPTPNRSAISTGRGQQ
jgi:UDP-N-acetyl-D-mannosaminuronate dehydrogenase